MQVSSGRPFPHIPHPKPRSNPTLLHDSTKSTIFSEETFYEATLSDPASSPCPSLFVLAR